MLAGSRAPAVGQPQGDARRAARLWPARTRSTTAAGLPFGNITARRAGVTVAGGTIRKLRVRSPRTWSVHAYSTGASSWTTRSSSASSTPTASAGGPFGAPTRRRSDTTWRPGSDGSASQYGAETAAVGRNRHVVRHFLLLIEPKGRVHLYRCHTREDDAAQAHRRRPAQHDLDADRHVTARNGARSCGGGANEQASRRGDESHRAPRARRARAATSGNASSARCAFRSAGSARSG